MIEDQNIEAGEIGLITAAWPAPATLAWPFGSVRSSSAGCFKLYKLQSAEAGLTHELSIEFTAA